MGALLKCQFGNLPSPISVLMFNKVSGLMPFANVNDHIPFINIVPFGICDCPGNPTVLPAKLAGITVPCTPVTPSPWSGAAQKVKVGSMAAITKDSKLACIFGGQITVSMPGQLTVFGA